MPNADVAEIKVCPHCGRSFVCRNKDIFTCQCVEVRLTVEARVAIAELYEDCLCVECLRAFAIAARDLPASSGLK